MLELMEVKKENNVLTLTWNCGDWNDYMVLNLEDPIGSLSVHFPRQCGERESGHVRVIGKTLDILKNGTRIEVNLSTGKVLVDDPLWGRKSF